MPDRPRIVLDVRRRDGDVTRLSGEAAIAVITTFHRDDPPHAAFADVPPVAIRCDTQLQIAVCLAAIIAAVEGVAPGVTDHALRLATGLDGRDPQICRKLPSDATPSRSSASDGGTNTSRRHPC